MGEILVITSGKGGVGKTTSTANLGTALALAGKRVVLVDTDMGLRNLDVVMGLDDAIVYDLVDVVKKTCRLEQGLLQDNQLDQLFLLPASQTKEKTAITPAEIKELAIDLSEKFDFVLFDCPAGLSGGFQEALADAAKGIVVVTPDFPAVRDAGRVIDSLEENGIQQIYLLINRFRQDMADRGCLMSIDELQEILGHELLAVVPEDDQMFVAASQGKPLVHQQESKGAQAYCNAAKRLLGESIPIMSFQEQNGFFTRLKKAFAK